MLISAWIWMGKRCAIMVCSFVQNHQILTGALDLALVVSDIIIRGYYVCMNENMYQLLFIQYTSYTKEATLLVYEYKFEIPAFTIRQNSKKLYNTCAACASSWDWASCIFIRSIGIPDSYYSFKIHVINYETQNMDDRTSNITRPPIRDCWRWITPWSSLIFSRAVVSLRSTFSRAARMRPSISFWDERYNSVYQSNNSHKSATSVTYCVYANNYKM